MTDADRLPQRTGFRAIVATLLVALLAACEESPSTFPVDPERCTVTMSAEAWAVEDCPADVSDEEAIQMLVFEKLSAMKETTRPHASCISWGQKGWPEDPSPAVVDHLTGADKRFVPVSTCALSNGVVKLDGEDAQLLHVELIYVEGKQATVSAYFQRTQRNRAGFMCVVQKSARGWQAESCIDHPESEEWAFRTQTFSWIAAVIPWLPALRPDIKAFCVSERSWESPTSPRGVTLFPLLSSVDNRFYPLSACQGPSGTPVAPGNQRAMRIHLSEVTVEGSNRKISFILEYDSTRIALHGCNPTHTNWAWLGRLCESHGASPPLTTDDVDIRAALFRQLAGPPWPNAWTSDHWCIREYGDPDPAVFAALADDSRKFYPKSSCMEVPVSGYDTPTGERAGTIEIIHILRRGGVAEATVNGLYPFGGNQFHCRLEKSDVGLWEIETCMRWAILN